MLVRNTTIKEIKEALNSLNKKYRGNITKRERHFGSDCGVKTHTVLALGYRNREGTWPRHVGMFMEIFGPFSLILIHQQKSGHTNG
jgi:hypothetical protein